MVEEAELQRRTPITPSAEPAELAREILLHGIRPKKRKSSETDADLAQAAYTSGVDYARCEKIWRGHWQ